MGPIYFYNTHTTDYTQTNNKMHFNVNLIEIAVGHSIYPILLRGEGGSNIGALCVVNIYDIHYYVYAF